MTPRGYLAWFAVGVVFCSIGIALLLVGNTTVPVPADSTLPPSVFEAQAGIYTAFWHGVYFFLVATGIAFLIQGYRVHSRSKRLIAPGADAP